MEQITQNLTNDTIGAVVVEYFNLKEAIANGGTIDENSQILKINEWNTSNVTNMSALFLYRPNFNEDISGWDTSKVTDMSYMFSGCEEFNQPLNWNTENVTDMTQMFAHCSKFNQPLNWNTSKVTNMSQMFFYCKMFNQSLDLDTSNVTDMTHMFLGCIKFNTYLDLDTKNVTDMSHMFEGCKEFNQDIAWNTSNVTNMSQMFSGCKEFNQPLNWNTSNVTNMSQMFSGCKEFNQDIAWNTSKVTNMSYMFLGCIKFNTYLDLDTKNVTDMSHMFEGCKEFNQDIAWNTRNVTNMSYMFLGCIKFNTYLDLDTRNVTDMSYMFSRCEEFNGELGNSWNTSNVTNMSNMFVRCVIFNQPLNWNTSNVTDMSYMFYMCIQFNGNISGWDTSRVINMSHMFFNCVNFKQNISTWNVSNVTDMRKMFLDSGIKEVDIENWEIDTNADTYEMFSLKSNFLNLRKRSNSIVYTNQTDQGTCSSHTTALVIARLIKVIFSSHFVEKESCHSLYKTGKNLDEIYKNYVFTLNFKDCQKELLSSLLFLLIYRVIVDKHGCGVFFDVASNTVFEYFKNFRLKWFSKCKIQELKKKIYSNYDFKELNQKLETNLLLLIAIITTFQQFIDNKIINISRVFTGYRNAEEIIEQIKKPLANNIYAYLGIDDIRDKSGHSICVIKQYQTKTGIKLLTKNSWGMNKSYRDIINPEGYIEPGVLQKFNNRYKYYIGYLNYTMTIPENQRQMYVEQELSKTLKNVIEICKKEIIPSNVAVPSKDTKKVPKRSFLSRLFTRGGTKKSLYKTHRKLIHKRKTRKYFTL